MNISFIIRLSKIMVLLSIAALALVVVFGNITDYDSNYQFVKHMMSMDTKPDYLGKAIEYRAVTDTFMHHFMYICVIITETIIAITALIGAYHMLKAIRLDADSFHKAKVYGIISLTLCCLLWFFGFQVVAGEWFAMWMSKTWNGLPDAFRLVTYMSVALVYLSLKNDD